MNQSPESQPPAVASTQRGGILIRAAVIVAMLAVIGLAWWLVHRPAPPQAFGGFGGPGFGGGFGPPGGGGGGGQGANLQRRQGTGGPPGGFPGGSGFAGQARPGGFGNRFPVTTVGVASAVAGDMPVVLEELGTVMPTATVTVRPRVTGPITQVNFKEGQIVNAGEVLATIDPRPYEAARLQAEGNLRHDQAALDAARVTLARYETLLPRNLISQQDYDTQKALVQQLEGTVISDKGALDNARLNVEFTRITSPVHGRVGLRVVDVGNYLAAGDANGVAVVTVLDPIDVELTVPQDEVQAIYARLAHDHTPIAVTALDRTRTVTLAKGTFLTLDNVVNTSTGTVKAKARFSNASGTLFPQQFVNVRMLLDTEKNAVVIPVGAVRTGSNGTFVYVLNRGSSTVSMRNVRPGHSDSDRIAILEGLQPGEEVITEGGDRLTDGARVQLPSGEANGPQPRRSWTPPGAGNPAGPAGTGQHPRRAATGTDSSSPSAPSPGDAGGPATNATAAPQRHWNPAGAGLQHPPGGWNGGGQNGAPPHPWPGAGATGPSPQRHWPPATGTAPPSGVAPVNANGTPANP